MSVTMPATQAASIEDEALLRVSLPDGLEFHYVERGQGTPVVFVHGVLGDWRTWAPQWPAFSARARAISYSRRYSVPNRNAWRDSPHHSALVEADDLHQLLRLWQAEPAVLVASSYGAYTALALAVRHPQQVRAMVLLEPPMLSWADATPRGRAEREAFDRDIRLPAREAFLRGDDAHAVGLLTAGIVGPAALAAMPEQALRRRLENALSIRRLTLSSDEFPHIDAQALGRIACPVLLMAGERTAPIHAAVFEAVSQAMPQARVMRVPDAGHGAARDNPAWFNRAALDFLQPMLEPPQP